MTARDYLTIGEVVEALSGNHPDLSISKIRFLEEEGLIVPERTPGGYRKFSQNDVSRLELILKLQREHFLPLAVILYWFANNIWTFGQQHVVFGKIEKEEEAKKLEALERRAANAPAPGKKPNKARKAVKETAENPDGADTSVGKTSVGKEPADPDTATEAAGSANSRSTQKSQNAKGSSPRAPGNSPRPGSRPNKRKR